MSRLLVPVTKNNLLRLRGDLLFLGAGRDLLDQLGFLVGLCQIGVGACLARFLAVLLAGARGNHDDRDVP